MTVTNEIDIKEENVKTCSDFAVSFVNTITRKSQSYDDRYVASSLKSSTGMKRTHEVSVRYKISDESKIGHLTTKQFLANIETMNLRNILQKNYHHR